MKKLLFIIMLIPLFSYSQKDTNNVFYGSIVFNLFAPNYGFSYMWIHKDIGVFGDLKFKAKFSTKYKIMDNMSEKLAISYGDQYDGEDNIYMVINAGGCYKIEDFILYGGIGIAYESIYHNYTDPFEILGNKGKYSVCIGGNMRFNFVTGVNIKITDKLIIRLGYESYKPGLDIGVGWKFKL